MLSSLALGFNAPMMVPHASSCMRADAVTMETKADLVKLAEDLNPVVGYWDPIGLSDLNLWGQGEEATIGWIRESEIKHGRIAMVT